MIIFKFLSPERSLHEENRTFNSLGSGGSCPYGISGGRPCIRSNGAIKKKAENKTNQQSEL